ncbi:MAG TPA: carboxypeptidase regulatory-like domain-containing protein [Vicinamibacterales bacterium]|nr:carboxypeptidase regulatory-like domain-containing protein [Vicinamibacterales bacterium]
MSRLRRVAQAVVPVCGLILLSALAVAQSGPVPLRDTAARQATAQTPPGAISGVVRTEGGRPISRARVTIIGSELAEGRSVMTDASGVFKFAGLRGGRFTVTASKAGYLTMSYGQRRPFQPGTPLHLTGGQELSGVEFRLPAGSAISGRISDESGDLAAGVTVQALRLRYTESTREFAPAGIAQTDDRGQYRIWGLNPGTYYVSASNRANLISGEPAVDGAADEPVGYAPTYYPGVVSMNDAQPVSVGLANEAADVSFNLLLVRTAQVSGHVFGSNGHATWSGMVSLVLDGEQNAHGGPLGTRFSTSLADDGGFSISDVPPGRYRLSARSTITGEAAEFGTMPVTVDGAAVSVALTLAPGGTLSGAVVLRPSTSETLPDLDRFRISVSPVRPTEPGGPPTAVADRDGKFTITAVRQGLHWIRGEAPRGWMLASVLYDGRDVVDTPFEIRGGQSAAGVTAVFTDRLAGVQGTLTNERGQPLSGETVLAFPTNASLWYAQSRRIVPGKPDQDGRFEIVGLPPGEYYLAAVNPGEPEEWFEPRFLESCAIGAVRLMLSEGELKTQNLRAISR